jgi:hypothetical protein
LSATCWTASISDRAGHFIGTRIQCGDHTLDDLLTVAPAASFASRGNAADPGSSADVSGSAMAGDRVQDPPARIRTGITRLNKGVDEDTLNDTAKGQAQLMARGQQMERYIIRNFAEGVARLFMKKVGLMRKYGQPFRIRVDGEYREVDPSQWPEDMEVKVKVGLGSGLQAGPHHVSQHGGAGPHAADAGAGSDLHVGERLQQPFGSGQGHGPRAERHLHASRRRNPQQQPQQDPEILKLQAELQLKQQQLQAQHAASGDGDAKMEAQKPRNDHEAEGR